MGRWQFNFDVLTNRYPIIEAEESSVVKRFLGVIKSALLKVTNALNAVYKAASPVEAEGDELDKWGEVLSVKRLEGEDDESFRARMLESLRDIRGALTIGAVKERLAPLLGSTPEVIEHRGLGRAWPLQWGDVLGEITDVQRVLVVVPAGLSDDVLDEARDELEDALLVSSEGLIVEAEEGGNYKLLRRVNDGE